MQHLQKNAVGGGWISSFLESFTRHWQETQVLSLYTVAHSFAPTKNQLFCFQAIPHSFARTPGGGVSLCSVFSSTGVHLGLSGASNSSFSVDSQLTHNEPLAMRLAFSSRMYSIYAALGSWVQQQAASRFQDRHVHGRQQRKSTGNATQRLPVPLRLQHRSQNHRSQLSLACAVQRLPWHGYVAAHAHPSGLAGSASPVPLQPRQFAGSLCRAHYASWFADGFSGAHRRAPSWLRKLFSSAANRRARNGFSHAEPSRVLAHSSLALWHDRDVLPFSAIRHHALDRQRRHLLRRLSPQRAQFQRYDDRSPRPWHDAAAASTHRLGLVQQRYSRCVNFQYSAGGLRLFALRPPLEHALFPPTEFHFLSACRSRRECRSRALAATLLVFRPSRSLCRHAPMFRPYNSFDFHVFPQTGLERAPRGSGALWRGPLG